MTFGELITLFESYSGTQGEVENSDLALWFNEAQIDLAQEVGQVVEWVPGDAEKHDLPADFLRVVDSTGGYELLPNGKLIAESADTVIYYFSAPEDFTGTDQDQECVLNSTLHNLLAMFACSRYFDQESEGDTEESNHATKWMSYYERGKQQAKARLTIYAPRLDKWRIE